MNELSTLRRVAVFTGSRPGARAAFLRDAERLGRALAARGTGLVYGGASVGLMGAVADAALAAGGAVTGVIPRALAAKEIAHEGLSELRVVASMHERKALMADLADGFVALPGGFGTFDELFEIVTWAQLGIHRKPIGILDTEGYFEPLRALVERVVAEGFALAEHAGIFLWDADPERLLDAMAAYRAGPVGAKWVTRDER
jgi:uncharacterized protein (TIGR00730 family)